MKHILWISLGIAVVVLVGILTGCGEKIAIPVAEGDFEIVKYDQAGVLKPEYEVRQIMTNAAGLQILGPDRLERRNFKFTPVDSVFGLLDARAFCFDEPQWLVFVWEEGLHRVSWYDASSLIWVGAMELPAVATVVAMATNSAGIEQVPGASTYLYLSDPVQNIVHRYAFDQVNDLIPHGILTRPDGQAVRFVHRPAGMATDRDGRLLICDQDTVRNWVIRFDSTPDTNDVTPDPTDEDPLRGLAVVFVDSLCRLAPPAGEFVLGFAPECEGPPWEGGGTSNSNGQFHTPSSVAVDGSGRIFVSDTGNHRIQIFDPRGDYILQFGKPKDTPRPSSVGVIDQLTDTGTAYAAYVYIHLPERNEVVRYISAEYDGFLSIGNPEDIP